MTEWANKSKFEVLPGSSTSFGGPHQPKIHLDEVELMPDADKLEDVRPDAQRGVARYISGSEESEED